MTATSTEMQELRKYEVCVIFDASRNVTVHAKNPQEAADLAEDEAHGSQHLCNQCSATLDTGDAIGAHVYEGDKEVLDSTAAGELRVELEAAKARIKELEASQAQRATQTTDSSEVISNEELQQAFSGTNFGTDDFRGLLHVAILKKACHYHCGHTITTIMKDLRLIGTNGQPLKRGIELLRAAYSNQMQG